MSNVASVHDASTQAFIDEDPSNAVVERRKRTTVGGGGWQWQHVAYLPVQQCRQVLRGNVNDTNQRTLPDGRVVVANSVLVFLLGGDIQEGDLVRIDGVQYEVIRTKAKYDVTAEVIKHADT